MEHQLHYRLKVRSYNLDSFGHVNNAVYLNYLEEARGDYLEQLGLSFTLFHQWQAFAIVVSAEIAYKSPAKFSEILDIRGAFSAIKRSSFTINYEIYNETTAKLCAVAKMTFAFVDGNGRVIAMPQAFREKTGDGGVDPSKNNHRRNSSKNREEENV
jgi:YbgC/YbaW family acyl-CoA thioester hydrolase